MTRIDAGVLETAETISSLGTFDAEASLITNYQFTG